MKSDENENRSEDGVGLSLSQKFISLSFCVSSWSAVSHLKMAAIKQSSFISKQLLHQTELGQGQYTARANYLCTSGSTAQPNDGHSQSGGRTDEEEEETETFCCF